MLRSGILVCLVATVGRRVQLQHASPSPVRHRAPVARVVVVDDAVQH